MIMNTGWEAGRNILGETFLCKIFYRSVLHVKKAFVREHFTNTFYNLYFGKNKDVVCIIFGRLIFILSNCFAKDATVLLVFSAWH